MRDDPTIVRIQLGLPPAADAERVVASVGEFAAARGVELGARPDGEGGAELPQGRVDEHAEARLASLLASVVRRKTGFVAASHVGMADDRVVRDREVGVRAAGCGGRCVWRADLVALIVCVVVTAAATAMIAFPVPPR